MTEATATRAPDPDRAEDNAFFPSAYSLQQYVTAKTDFDGASYEDVYRGGKLKILLIGADERYLMMGNGRFFSTGNHPVETLLPLAHLDAAGFDIDVATVSGGPVKFEWWAFPGEDPAMSAIYEKFRDRFRRPKKLSDLMSNALRENSTYIGVFIPGGHGAMNNLPYDQLVGEVLRWALSHDRFIITLCHGPAALLAAEVGRQDNDFAFSGYACCVFPDALDAGANVEIGYIPGAMPWLVAEELSKRGVKIVNKDMSGQVHRDRHLITGDSPLAANKLGRLAAETLLGAVKT